MSDPPPPPFPQPTPEPALPPAPQWVPPAVPVQSLGYTLPSRGQRPGILTAVGVLSICIAGLSGLYSLLAGFQGFGFYMMSIAAARATTIGPGGVPTATVIPGTMPSTSPSFVTPASPLGMPPAERKAVIAALTKNDPLDPPRQRQLDAILAAVGRTLGTETVTDRGTMPDSRTGEAGPEYFVTRRGRLEVFDDRAVFFPNDGSPTVRISAPPPAAATTAPVNEGTDDPATTAPAVGPGGLTQVEVSAVVQQADTLLKGAAGSKGLTPQQVNTIRSLLSIPGQQLVPPGTSQGAVTHSVPDGTGSVYIGFTNGSQLEVGATGAVLSQTSPNLAAAGGVTGFSMSPVALALFIATTVLSLGLAVLLLVAGIQVLRQAHSGRRLHLIYACIKLPAAIAGGAALAYLVHEMINGFASAAAAGAGMPAGTSWRVVAWTAVPAALSCIYPIALLITMNTRSVRDYYHSVAEG